jgi:hypothetical protein
MAEEVVQPFYADLDEGTGLYCVFHSETGKAHTSFANMAEAEKRAKEMNEAQKHD